MLKGLLSLSGRYRILNLSWFAFFLTFVVWFNFAGLIAATYPFMNLISRSAGGFISNKIGSRKWTLTAMLGGVGIGYFLLSRVTGGWFLPLVIVMTMTCAFFVFGAAGATFGIAPLIKRRVIGQIAGNFGHTAAWAP